MMRDRWPADSLLTCAQRQVQRFRHARRCRRLELVEDYVELIADLIEARGEARQVEIAARLGVAQPTVAKMLRRLADEGFIKQRPTSGVFLTGAGQELARTSRLRHRTVECFLRALGISLATARIDAEGMEHRVSPETLAAFKDFLSKKPTEAASQSRSRASARMGRFPP